MKKIMSWGTALIVTGSMLSFAPFAGAQTDVSAGAGGGGSFNMQPMPPSFDGGSGGGGGRGMGPMDMMGHDDPMRPYKEKIENVYIPKLEAVGEESIASELGGLVDSMNAITEEDDVPDTSALVELKSDAASIKSEVESLIVPVPKSAKATAQTRAQKSKNSLFQQIAKTMSNFLKDADVFQEIASTMQGVKDQIRTATIDKIKAGAEAMKNNIAKMKQQQNTQGQEGDMYAQMPGGYGNKQSGSSMTQQGQNMMSQRGFGGQGNMMMPGMMPGMNQRGQGGQGNMMMRGAPGMFPGQGETAGMFPGKPGEFPSMGGEHAFDPSKMTPDQRAMMGGMDPSKMTEMMKNGPQQFGANAQAGGEFRLPSGQGGSFGAGGSFTAGGNMPPPPGSMPGMAPGMGGPSTGSFAPSSGGSGGSAMMPPPPGGTSGGGGQQMMPPPPGGGTPPPTGSVIDTIRMPFRFINWLFTKPAYMYNR